MILDKSGRYLEVRKQRLPLTGEEDMKADRRDTLFASAPGLLAIIAKLIKFRKGGYSKAERQELGEDLLDLALEILQELD